MNAAALPAEFRLGAACCIWPPGERRNRAIRAAAAGAIDWDAFLRFVRRQRIAGLANDGLKSAEIAVPPDAAAALTIEAGAIAKQALQLASEALRLQAAFDTAGIPALFVKGSALAVLAYGNLGIKHAWDIDLLVTPSDVRQACALLEGAGYTRIMPPASFADERFHAWLEFAREGIFHNAARHSHVELHWRLSDNRTQLADVTARSPANSVAISPRHPPLRTLCDEDLFAYLCLHGAHHAWARMKWLADLAAWLSGKPPAEIARLYAVADAHRAGRAAAQALLLCADLFGLPLPAPLAEEMRADRATRWLVAIALEAMTGERLLHNFKIEGSHFLLAPGFGHWLAELQSKSVGWTDFQAVQLPRPLYFLYPILRLPSWVWRRLTEALKPGQPAA
ncbi:MAG: nucleotidyltransferase family protein [Rhizomicrobium sp.]